MKIDSVTHTLPVPDVEAGRVFYAQLLGREPDLIPAPAVYEWKLREGAWLQITVGTPGPGQILRFGVADLQGAAATFDALGGTLEPPFEIPELIRMRDATDPFGNQLCFYMELAETSEPGERP